MDSFKPLDLDFYHQDVTTVAQLLLGKYIAVDQGSELFTLAKIVETEAYDYPDDKGSHTYQGRRSPRNESMYKAAGSAYVYKCYGTNDMLNIVVGPEGIGKAVLIRAIQPIIGLALMHERRGMTHNDYRLTGGPGKVCQALGITKALHDGIELINLKSPIALLMDENAKPHAYVSTPRVGMSIYVAESSNWAYRYYTIDTKYVSRPLRVWYEWG